VPADDELMTVGEIADIAGVHENTVRRYLKDEQVPFYLRDLSSGRVISGDRPREQWPPRYQYLIPAEVASFIAAQAGDSVAASPPPSASDQPITASDAAVQELTELRAELAETHRRLNTSHERLQQLRDERDWLRQHLDDVTAFLPAAREEVQEAQSEVEAFQQQTEALQDQVQHLDSQRDLERQARHLAAARFQALSWWRRLTTDLDQLIDDELQRLRANCARNASAGRSPTSHDTSSQ
jgi:predicted transcriptional regulator